MKLLSVFTLLALAACAVNPEFRDKRREELAIWEAEFQDFKSFCHRSGGYVVQYPPEIGGRYRCAR